MSKFVPKLLSVLLLSCSLLTGCATESQSDELATTQSTDNVNTQVTSNSDNPVSQILNQLNRYRADNGVGTLASDPELDREAAVWANNIAAKAQLIHDPKVVNGGGENLYRGIPTENQDIATMAFISWKNSPVHNQNMLRPVFTKVGIACVLSQVDNKTYCVQKYRTR